METIHIYTSTRYVILKINTKMQELGDWKYFDILIFQHQGDHTAIRPESYKDFIDILNKYDKVYAFNKVETKLHGALGYDIILEK